MSTLSPIDPKVNFHDLEPLICDAVNMTDVLVSALNDHFSNAPPKNGFIIDPDDGSRLFFLASMVTAMSDKVLAAYYVAWENGKKKDAQS